MLSPLSQTQPQAEISPSLQHQADPLGPTSTLPLSSLIRLMVLNVLILTSMVSRESSHSQPTIAVIHLGPSPLDLVASLHAKVYLDSECELKEDLALDDTVGFLSASQVEHALDLGGSQTFSINDLEHLPVLLSLWVLGSQQKHDFRGTQISLSKVTQVHECALGEVDELSLVEPDKQGVLLVEDTGVLVQGLGATQASACINHIGAVLILFQAQK